MRSGRLLGWCQPTRVHWQAEFAEEGPSGSSVEWQIRWEGSSAEGHTVPVVQKLSSCLASVVVVGDIGAAVDQTSRRVYHRSRTENVAPVVTRVGCSVVEPRRYRSFLQGHLWPLEQSYEVSGRDQKIGVARVSYILRDYVD